ncbi:hypothetical protein CROQUDRAFT_35913 [Cronartium quercuum f. sp. fusiforme G11]|uniref:Transcription factor domain-containing protein n=1 Tax=Cronartium quercuum f. sp. fusiforme G11 TaxID=708437 RepID=A0A9P6NRH5_9BASI|nr:hypothetical protein CROQUDRAFT_35913 [Cronartium quercuum f. sp. fusiforme G11]
MQGLLGLGAGLSTITAVMKHLPTLLQIKSCLEQFEAHRAWMHRILHRQQFWKQVYEQILQDFATYRSSALHDIGLDEYRRQLHWLAILFAICGLGLFNNLLDDSQALQLGFPSGIRPQRDLAVRWCVCSTSCLQLGEYDQHPTIESIQAMAILAQLPLYTSNGETLGIVLGFLGSAIELASKLGLNIDPDEDPRYVNASALVKQDRRRLMIALLCQHYKMGGLACQTLGLQSPSEYKIQLPLDQFDEDFDLTTGALINPRTPGSTHTIMTGIRCRFQVSQVWQEIGILFADVKTPLIHEKIMALDRQLLEIEKTWPTCIRTRFEPSTATFMPSFKVHTDRPGLETTTEHPILLIDRLGCFSVLANAMIRLHRGFLVAHDGIPSQDVALHRSRVLHFGRSMLAIHRTTLLPLDHVPLQFFVFSSSIALAVYCLTAKPESDEVGEVMKELIQLVETLKPIVSQQIK